MDKLIRDSISDIIKNHTELVSIAIGQRGVKGRRLLYFKILFIWGNEMNAVKINEAMEKIKPGLEKYLKIMNIVNEVDVSSDESFKKTFNGYYRIRQINSIFYEKYYLFMESNKSKDISFEKALLYFYKELGRVEASFSSKLVATINPDLPIWDSVVLKNLNLSQPRS